MSLGSLIRSRREELDVTQEVVAAQVGISKPYLSNIETGKAKNPPSDGVLRSLERAMNFRPGQLLRIAHEEKTPTDVRARYEELLAEVNRLRGALRDLCHGDRQPDESWEEPDEAIPVEQVGQLPGGVVVPVINRVNAGYPHHFTDLGYPAGIADEYIRCPDVHDPQAFAARVVGDSMEPDYQKGDIVVFSPALEPQSGDDCFVRLGEDQGTTFKRVYMDDKQTLRLQPLNPAHPAQRYSREQITGLWPALFRVQRLRKS